MEFEKNYREDLTYPQILLPNNYMKPEIEDDFYFKSCSSKGYFQDIHHLDQFSFTGSSPLNPEFGVQTTSSDPFDPFMSICSLDLDDLYESKPFVENGGTMQSFNNGGGYLKNPKKTPVDVTTSDPSCMTFDCQEDIKPLNFVIPDEGSCITAENGYYKEVGIKKNGGGSGRGRGRRGSCSTAAQGIKKPCKGGRKKSHSVKGQWTIEEDRLLIHLVQKYGVRKWSNIAQMLKGRIGKQCRERWHNHLRPDIKKDTWSEEEDKILIQAHLEVGNKWAEIAKSLPGRTENSIKNHWNATKRRQYTRRKCRSKFPRPSSILQNYIKSLNLDGKLDITAATNAPPVTTGGGPKLINTTLINPPLPMEAEMMEFCAGDRLVPNFDFNEVPDFAFSENMFDDSSIDSLLDQMPCPAVDDGKSFDLEVSLDNMASFMQCEVKKEIDLVEMITQVNL
ncbi:hypothetical protein U1Q18_035464 [Sarracenia purpurea var. burkii]